MDLDASIYHYEQALHYREGNSVANDLLLSNLGLARVLIRRYEVLKNVLDADRAYQLLQSAANLPEPKSNNQALLLFELAGLHLATGTAFYSLSDALTNMARALDISPQPVHSCLRKCTRLLLLIETQIGVELCNVPESSKNALLDIYKRTIQLLPRVAYVGLDTFRRLEALRGVSDDVPVSAACCAASLGKDKLAVQLLEQGNAVFWQQHLQLRTALDDLPSDLADRLGKTMAALESSHAKLKTSSFSSQHENAKIAHDRIDVELRRLSRQLDSMIAEHDCRGPPKTGVFPVSSP